jgi:hypothetical protein
VVAPDFAGRRRQVDDDVEVLVLANFLRIMVRNIAVQDASSSGRSICSGQIAEGI